MNKPIQIFIILFLLANCLLGQNNIVKTDSIQYDHNISDTIFSCNDSIVSDKLESFPINANCITDNLQLLESCNCFMKNDTVYIVIGIADARALFIWQTIKINKNKFTTLNETLEPFSIDAYIAYPIKQRLILKSDEFIVGKQIYGFIDFEGKGKYTINQIKVYNSFPDAKMTKEQIEKGFSCTVKGYFKCKIKEK